MRLVTYLRPEREIIVGLLRGESIVDLMVWYAHNRVDPIPPAAGMLDLIGRAEFEGFDLAGSALDAPEALLNAIGALLPLDPSRLLAPVPRPTKNVMCLGRNYHEHAVESARAFGEAPPAPAAPAFPIFFTKAPTAVNGPYAPIPFDPEVSEQIDWECELALVIGRTGKNIPRDEAMGYVFGYTVVNDVSARDIQSRHGNQFFKGKSLDGSCPMGPWIVTADELDDPSNLQLWTRVNGVEKQHGNTRDMLFDIPAIIESLSQGMTLEPGDIIATGTPAGIGHARTPPEYLRPGDVVECEIEGIGSIRNSVMREQ